MEKQRIKMLKIYLLLMGILLLLTGCKETETEAEVEDTLAVTAPKDSSDNQADNLYTLLNQDLLGKAFLQQIGEDLIADEAYVFAEEIKEEFAPTEQTPEKFPQALTVMLEKALYHSDSAETRGEDSVYEQTIYTMVANRYILDLEDLYVQFSKIAD